jgi:hypothetical protein
MTAKILRLWTCVVCLTVLATGALAATTPSSGTISPASPNLSFTGGPFPASNPADPLGNTPPACTDAVCGQFAMTVAIPSIDFNSYRAKVTVSWTNSGTTTQGSDTSDYDVYIYLPDVTGSQTTRAASSANPEVAAFPVSNGTYTIYVVPYDVSPTVPFSATVTLTRVGQTPWPPPAGVTTVPPGTPRFFNYHAPPGVAESAGEPSIGVNRNTEQIFGGIPNGGTANMFGGFLPYMVSAAFDDRTSPAAVTWRQVPLVLTTAPRAFGDPYLFTDRDTGRTFVAQEMGLTPLGSTMEFTDNDNAPFTPSTGSGAPSGVDHETVGGGPFHTPIPTGVNPLYQNSVWYCSQSIADAVCSISLDGGMTFGPAVPMFSVKDCSGLHGHIKIGPDGTAYVPDRACGGSLPFHTGANARQAVIVSEDNGITWKIRSIPTATTLTDRDPSVAIDAGGTVYFAYQAGDGHSHVVVSSDKGVNWGSDTDVGVQVGVQNSLFHASAAGDAGRAAITFFGTEMGGSGYANPDFPGVWYLYVSTTFDGGAHWTTQNVTPGDPIQRGGICGSGACRNLLDFFDATIDKEGRILVGYDDGCISDNCVSGFRSYGLIAPNDFTAKATIARQASGLRMYAAYDSMAGPDINPQGPPPPPPRPTSCDGVVATDPAGDADHPLLHSNGGNADQVDITALSFGLTPDKQNLTTTITLKNFIPQPINGSLGTFYYATWTAARKNDDGSIATRTYATRVAIDATGAATYRFGQYDQANDAFVGTATVVSGSYVTGPNGSVSVTVPLSLLGNPTIPVTDTTSLPAVIEPYALAIITEQAVRFVQPADRAPNAGSVGASWSVCVPTVTCIDDDDPSIAYGQGWHSITNASASGGHFRLHEGGGGSASITIAVSPNRTGKVTYYYATSPKGGSAEIFIDGVSKGTVSYLGTQGSTRAPLFGASVAFGNLAAGNHTFEIRNTSGAVYVDRFCLEDSTSTGHPASGPGQTTQNSSSLAAAQESISQVSVPSSAQSISVVAEATPDVPVKMVLVDPSGLALATADSSSGIAVINQPVTQGGIYLVKVVNLSLGPVDVWTATTPLVSR